MRWNHHQARFATVLWLALLVSAPAPAENAACPKLDPVSLSLLLMPPPGDDQTSAELRELQDLERLRNQDQEKEEHARGDSDRSLDRFLGEVGIKVNDRSVGARRFFKCIGASTEADVRQAKGTFNRTRPYNLANNELHPLKDPKPDDSSSYPSGHATYGMVTGLLLAEMLPEQRAVILKRIDDYGLSRMISGVHFRSDVYAGQISGAAIAASYFKSDAFRKAFEKAKADLRAALGYR
jgi:acid phosphatase (class A)